MKHIKIILLLLILVVIVDWIQRQNLWIGYLAGILAMYLIYRFERFVTKGTPPK